MGIPVSMSPPIGLHGAGRAQSNWRSPSLGKASQCWSLCRYDRTKLTLKDIHNCQYVACMNPTAGSFTIDSRLQVNRMHRDGACPSGFTVLGLEQGGMRWDGMEWDGGHHGAGCLHQPMHGKTPA